MKKNEMVVRKDDFGFLVECYVSKLLQHNPYVADGPHGTDARIREWWPQLEEYYQRHIMTSIEVALVLDEPPRYGREPMDPIHKILWKKIVADLRGPKSAFTVDYHCHKCKAREVKLWRGVHGCSDKDGHDLLCATCLAPGITVDDNGKWDEPGESGMHTDQVKGWLPAIPVGDTYWGYSSVPSQDVEWWIKLPTYKLCLISGT